MSKNSRCSKFLATILVAIFFVTGVLGPDLFTSVVNAGTYRTFSEIKSMLDTKMDQSRYTPGGAPPSSYTSGSGCYGFVDMLTRYLFGHGLPTQHSNHYQFKDNYTTNYIQIGSTLTISSGNLTESSLKNLFSQAQPGDVIQMDYTPYGGGDSLHTMMVYSVSSTGVVFYHAGSSKVYFGASSGSQPLWGTGGKTLTWSQMLGFLKKSDDGISLYRSKYAQADDTTGPSIRVNSTSETSAGYFRINFTITDPSNVNYYSITINGTKVYTGTNTGSTSVTETYDYYPGQNFNGTLTVAIYARDDYRNKYTLTKDYSFDNRLIYGDFQYNIKSDNTIEIIDYLGSSSSVTIPSSINGKPVTSLGRDAFIYCDFITNVTIPNSVTTIGWSAFYECSGLTTITIPNSVTTIEKAAFCGCTGLTEIVIPNSVTYIDRSAFNNCPNLREVTLSNNITSIREYEFYNCSSLTEIYIPEGVTSILEKAFSGCSSLTNLTIPESVTTIADDAFTGCNNITLNVYYNSTAHEYAIENNIDFRLIYGDFLYNIKSDNTIEIIDYLGSSSSVSIPSSINGKPVTSIGNNAFRDCASITSITMLNSVTEIGQNAFYNCTSLTSITIPNSVTQIGRNAFTYCTSLTGITIPNSVTEIGPCAFTYCTSLTSITIPNSIQVINYAMFGECENLVSVEFSENLTAIGGSAFIRCSSLSNITIPENVSTIEESSFDGCDDVILNVYYNSTAHEYAIENSIDFRVINPPSTATPTSTPVPNQGSTIPPATGNTASRQEAQDFVTRCYELVLNRTPDTTGLNNWTNSLVNNQNTGAHVAYGFFFSQEFINSNKSNEEFVTILYRVFLNREPDTGGLADWVGQLEAGASREQVFAGVANSREFFNLCNSYGITAGHYIQGVDCTRQQNVNAFVARLYSMCLGRVGDYDGQANWVRQLINRQNSGAGVGYGFFFSPEFINRNLTNEEYVATLYRVFLGREPDQAGFNSWVNQLNNGADRLSIFRGFAHSQEYTNICNSYGIDRGSI